MREMVTGAHSRAEELGVEVKLNAGFNTFQLYTISCV
jgi:hypothetical protein